LIQGKPFIGDMIQYRKNGEKYWNLLRVTPVRDGNGTVTHYVGVKTDITFMKQKDLEIEDLHEENLHLTRVAELSEIVSSLAHEISQPLTAIHSYAQAAKRMLEGREPKTQEILQYIINDDQRAADVIRHLRSLLKKVKQVFESLDINVLLNETIKFMADNITARKAVLNIELDKDLPTINGDRVQLQQVLLNLINNSLDAMESCAGLRELLIRTSQKDINTIMVEVKDSGCGISAQSKEKLFTHFYTTKSKGLGMGLAISRSIIKAHGGQLDAKNNPDRGATFYFTIPVGVKENL
jgi:C4-dicarboxylate-specific signal transduction histidine kinase